MKKRNRSAEALAVIADIECILEGEGGCESCLLWSHIAQVMRQRGFAQGGVFDEHFTGTSLAAKGAANNGEVAASEGGEA